MRNPIIYFIAFLICTSFWDQISAQSSNPSIAILPIDNNNAELSPDQLASLTRIEVTKYGLFVVIDPYDIEYLFKKNEFDASECYGKICLIEAGNLLGVDKVLSGSVETFDRHVVITLRQVDVSSKKIEKAHAMEFLKIDNQLFTMIELTVRKMYGMEVDEDVVEKLTKKDLLENNINVPDVDVLNLSGPRMGLTILSGDIAKITQKPVKEGGYNSLPVMTQFGYQFELKYLNEGSIQALFEIIPIISGLDQGRILPSLSVLSGIRSNKNGFEFAFGPQIFATEKAFGYNDESGQFIITGKVGAGPNGEEIFEQLDSRGDFKIGSSFVIGIGKTFRSGKLNIPVNAFVIPGKDENFRYGISFGFNVSKNRN